MSRPEVVLHSSPRRHYTINGETSTPTGDRIVSVTQVLGILDKPALVNWAAKQTVEGCWRLMRRKSYELPDEAWKLTSDLKKHGLDYRASRDDAAARGTAVHAALEGWVKERKLPAPNAYPEAWRGYFTALAKFLMDFKGEFVESELAVGSLTHGFAGTRDTVAIVVSEEHGRALLDLKTSRRCYPGTHYRQLAAYELAGVEMGEEPTDAQAVVRLGQDGTFDIHWSNATADDFLHVLRVFRDNAKFREGEKNGR